MEEKKFKVIPNRDAWSTIRGFVYQVDTTILRWLDLRDNTSLFLETGEDIDIVTRDLKLGEISRELEQIKHRDKNITLKSDVSLETLLNFFLQKVANPGLNLSFRLITNANAGVERPTIFPETVEAGIDAWNRLGRDENLTDSNTELIKIKVFLLERVQFVIGEQEKFKEPNKEYLCNLKVFEEFLLRPTEFCGFLKSFEWSLLNFEAESMSQTIHEKMVQTGLIDNENNASKIYPRLFLFVFKLLSLKGPKQLTKDDLLAQLKLPDLGEQDNNLLKFIQNVFNELVTKVGTLENQMAINTNSIESLTSEFEILRKEGGQLDFKLRNLPIQPPMVIKNGSQRSTKVEEIQKLIGEKNWISFHGINGTGKSQLALLVSAKFTNQFWLELRPFYHEADLAGVIVEKFLQHISGVLIEDSKQQWLNRVIAKIPNDTVLVINDMPRLTDRNQLGELLVMLTNVSARSSLRVITTSNHALPIKVKNVLDARLFLEYDDLNFSKDEIIEYLQNSGAEESVIKYSDLISAVTSNNASLVGAVVEELKKINWGKESGDVFDVFFNKKFAKEILADAQDSIKAFIKDEFSRELLYRISLIHWTISHTDVKIIGQVPETIPHVNERLSDLLHLWIQEQEDQHYQVSPMIYDLGEKNLPQQVISGVHLAIARSMIRGKIVDQVIASRAIISFLKALDYDSAGSLLLSIYRSVKTSEDIKILKPWGFIDYWSATEIPLQMNILLRSFIRSEQIRIVTMENNSTLFLTEQLQKYLSEGGLSSQQMSLIRLTIVSNFDGSNLPLYWDSINGILDDWPTLDQPYKDIILGGDILILPWFVLAFLNSVEDIMNWLEVISRMEKMQKSNFFEHEMAQSGVSVLLHRIANSKIDFDHKYSNSYYLFEFLSKYFHNRNEEVMEALVLRELISYLFRIKEDIEVAVNLGVKKIGEFKEETSKYLIADILGKLFQNAKEEEDARIWLKNAVDYQQITNAHFVETLICAASSISAVDREKALSYCMQAATIVTQQSDRVSIEIIQVYCELGLANYYCDNFIESFNWFEKAALELFTVKPLANSKNDMSLQKADWIRISVILGHTLGYISNKIVYNKIPKKDGEDYVTPWQGVFQLNKNNFSDLYEDINDPIVMSYMALFAEGIEDIQKCYFWSIKAFDQARKNNNDRVFLMVSSSCGQYSLVNQQYDEALESNLLFTAMSTHAKGNYHELDKLSIQNVIAAKPNINWNEAEDMTISITVTAMLLQVLTLKLTGHADASTVSNKLQQTVHDYLKDASDKEAWQEMANLCHKILNRDISLTELITVRNNYAASKRKNLHAIAILGKIYFEHGKPNILTDLISFYPYVDQLYTNFSIIQSMIALPFLKITCGQIVRKNYVGSKVEVNSILSEVNSVKSSEDYCYQRILLLTMTSLDERINIPEDRRDWLYKKS